VKKKKANFIKFLAKYRQIHGVQWRCDGAYDMVLSCARRQYQLLCSGVRDVQISDTAIYAWDAGKGEW